VSYRIEPARLMSVVSATALLLLSHAGAARAGQGPSTTAPPTTAVPQSTIPLPNRMNEVLPTWLRVRAEFRERVEGFDNALFASANDDTYFLSRLRVNAVVTPSRDASFQVQVQDARVGDKEVGTTGTPFTATFDVRMAFADFGATTRHVTARVGRQELAFGEQRLVGHVSWLNAARTFDAGRVTIRSKKLTVDGFAASVVRILPDTWDKSGAGNRFYGAYASTPALVPRSSVEPYFFWRQDENVKIETGGAGTLHLATTGVRWAGSLPSKAEYGVEVAGQTGSIGTDAITTWAGHFQMKSAAFGPALRVTGEYNVASGDASPTDGTRGTFDQLYPTPHDKYGLADQVGWRNIHHMRAGLDIARIKNWPIVTNYHSWWLADVHDGLYAAGGAVLVPRIATGADNGHVGQEIDLQISRVLSPQLLLSGGYAYIMPGGFLKQATPGASYSAPFLMLTYVFLAEK